MSDDQRIDGPFYWRVADGVLYAEMPYSKAIRPPLLSEWESEAVKKFNSIERRSRWLAGRALAKALIREKLSISGNIDIREGAAGEPLVYSQGLPMPNIWLGISSRAGRVVAVIADRPVSVRIEPVVAQDAAIVEQVAKRDEIKSMKKTFDRNDTAFTVLNAVKNAAARAIRYDGVNTLKDVGVRDDFTVQVGDAHMHAMAIRVVENVVVAVVGRALLREEPTTRIVVDGDDVIRTSKFADALERSRAKARRVAEARARWSKVRWASQ